MNSSEYPLRILPAIWKHGKLSELWYDNINVMTETSFKTYCSVSCPSWFELFFFGHNLTPAYSFLNLQWKHSVTVVPKLDPSHLPQKRNVRQSFGDSVWKREFFISLLGHHSRGEGDTTEGIQLRKTRKRPCFRSGNTWLVFSDNVYRVDNTLINEAGFFS